MLSINNQPSDPGNYFWHKFIELGPAEGTADVNQWLRSAHDLAWEAAGQGAIEIAADIYQQCLRPAQKLWGEDGLNTLEFQRAYANELIKGQRLSEAASIYYSILPRYGPILSGSTADVAKAQAIYEDIGNAELTLVKGLYKQRKFADAAEICQSAGHLLDSALGINNKLSSRAKSDYNKCLSKHDDQLQASARTQIQSGKLSPMLSVNERSTSQQRRSLDIHSNVVQGAQRGSSPHPTASSEIALHRTTLLPIPQPQQSQVTLHGRTASDSSTSSEALGSRTYTISSNPATNTTGTARPWSSASWRSDFGQSQPASPHVLAQASPPSKPMFPSISFVAQALQQTGTRSGYSNSRSPSPAIGNIYGTTNISDQATVQLGNRYDNRITNIYNDNSELVAAIKELNRTFLQLQHLVPTDVQQRNEFQCIPNQQIAAPAYDQSTRSLQLLHGPEAPLSMHKDRQQRISG